MSDFAFEDSPSPARYRHDRPSVVGAWLLYFSANLIAVFFAGLLLLLLIRYYVRESVREALENLNKPVPARIQK